LNEGIKRISIGRDTHFWDRAHNNFVEIAVLEWCKVFGDKKGKHYSFKVVTDRTKFAKELLARLQMTQADFDIYADIMKNLRDKFIAHLDDDITAPLPKLDVALDSVKFLLVYLFANENKSNYLEGVPRFPDPVYRLAFDNAKYHYEKADAE
jgi:hypothetical protein